MTEFPFPNLPASSPCIQTPLTIRQWTLDYACRYMFISPHVCVCVRMNVCTGKEFYPNTVLCASFVASGHVYTEYLQWQILKAILVVLL